MRNGIFVTGGSGFVGRPLLEALQRMGRPVTALARSGNPPPVQAGITIVTGDVLAPDTYREALRSCDVVIHLAAVTGRASAAEHMRVNVRGTQDLLDACRAVGVPNILFVSSIATTFPDIAGYPYAEAKRRAEEAVVSSGLRYLILRPTIILGPGAPVLKALEKLALLPAVVVPGNGRVRVQPIHVDDIVWHITETVRLDRFTNSVSEAGGPDVLTMEELLQHVRLSRVGRTGRVVHVPLGAARFPLRVAEAVGLGPWMPISAGQLTSFRCDGVATNNPLSGRPGSGLLGMSHMVASPPGDTTAAARQLRAECRVFTRHLLGRTPDEYVMDRYRSAHETVPALAAGGRFDESLLACARLGPLGTKIADAYAGLFFRHSVLRKKLILLLAILETRPPFSETIDASIVGSPPVLLARLVLKTTGALLSLVAGTVIFTPIRAALALRGGGAR